LPELSVTAERVFSMSASLAASTVTPGNTAPLVSFKDPAMLPWARAARGAINTIAPNNRQKTRVLRIDSSRNGDDRTQEA
jgi:fatty acid/phospholipid biosynthesis enzyme